ncbi:MAG: methyltransferase domain-containing protein [Acidobacteria bacterium]|nr:methyltransferase domain-containing protein [Acidobacteriota bacterium]
MSASPNPSQDVAQKLREVREEIRRRLEVPSGSSGPREPERNGRARAILLAAAIGTASQRPGLAHRLIQMIQRVIARMLDWQFRPQREFNRAVVESLDELHQRATEQCARSERLEEQLKLQQQSFDETLRQQFAGIQENAQRLAALREYLDEQMKIQRWSYDGTLFRQGNALQEKIMGLVQNELRLLRQRVAAQARAEDVRLPTASAGVSGKATSIPRVDYFHLEQHFRGTEEEIRRRQNFYLPFFRGRQNVLDLACGRGEFLELMREAGILARGVDADADMIGHCREKGLEVVQADAFDYLRTIPDGSLDGIFCAQFVEHLAPEIYTSLLSQCARKLAPQGILAVETPNPECLAIFSQTFFLDPTHVRPIPPAQLRFLFTEAGLTRITTHFLSPASAAWPLIPPLPSSGIEADKQRAWNDAVAKFNETFFGGMDYAVIGYRPGSAGTNAEVPPA